jgi:hypothetical protein
MVQNLLSDYYRGFLNKNEVPTVGLLTGKSSVKTYSIESDSKETYQNMLVVHRFPMVSQFDKANGKHVCLFDADPNSKEFLDV